MAFYIFPNAVSKEKCNELLEDSISNFDLYDGCIIKEEYADEFITTTRTEKSDIEDFEKQRNRMAVNTEKRDSDIFFIKDSKHQINKICYELITEANIKFFDYNIDYFQEIQFSRYEVGKHYNWHRDDNIKNIGSDECRKLSLTLNISNDYDGGLFEFFDGGSPFKYNGCTITELLRSVGTAIVFDSSDWHRLTPVTRGVRYSYVCWAVGPNFK